MPTLIGIASNIPKAGYYLALSLFTVALGLFATNQFRLLYLANTDPVTFHDMIIDPSVVAPGDPLFVTAVLTRHRFCHSDRDEFIADVATNTNQWQARFANGSTAIGYVRIRNKYTISVLDPGEYVLRMVAFYKCSDGDTHTIRGPEAKFTVAVP
jgi:hypothetical protein